MVKTSLQDAGARANLIDRHRMIALLPEKIAGGGQEALLRAAGPSHISEVFGAGAFMRCDPGFRDRRTE